MNKVIHFFGLKRSGNHAILNWLQKNSELKNIKHFNNVYDLAENPPKIIHPIKIKSNIDSNTNLLIISYEDVNLGDLQNIPAFQANIKYIDNSERINILLLRDAYNFIASRMKMLESIKMANVTNPIQKISMEKVTSLWKSYAKEYLGITNYLSNTILINYDEWFSKKNYRNELILKIFQENDNKDIGINDVPENGRGSSFDGLNYNGKAQEMNVLERRKFYKEDSKYIKYTSDEELAHLNNEVFRLRSK